jgi:hypothetical protein
MAAAPPAKRGLPWWGWSLIAGSAVVVLAVVGFIVVMVIGFASYVTHSLEETSPDQAFIEGPPQQPIALVPVQCPDECLELDDATDLAVSAADLSVLSIEDEVYGVGALEPVTVAEVAPEVGASWLEIGGDEQCSFVLSNAPYFAVGPDSASADPILWVQTWETDFEMTDIAAREFPKTAEATAFMRDLHSRVAACPWQDLDVPSAGGLDTTLVQITAQAAIGVPEEVAAVGWVREGTPGPRWRSYVWDLQRGNLVVQVRVLTDGRILEEDVAEYAELIAGRLGELPTSPQ